jgi:GxxExxY protein
MTTNLIYKEESYDIVGAAMTVHSELGSGFLEAVYQEALAIELELRNIPFKREEKISIYYKGQILDKHYFADFICHDNIIIETKTTDNLTSVHEAQLINYLVATGKQLGILINFGAQSLQTKRIINKSTT